MVAFLWFFFFFFEKLLWLLLVVSFGGGGVGSGLDEVFVVGWAMVVVGFFGAHNSPN